MNLFKFLWVVLFVFWRIDVAAADRLHWENDKISLTSYSNYPYILIKAELKNGWHVAWENPGDAGTPVSFDWQTDNNTAVVALGQSVPQKFLYEDIITQYGYGDTAYYLFKASNKTDNIALNMSWAACRDYCEPEQTHFLFSDFANTAEESWDILYQQALKTFTIKTTWDIFSEIKNDVLYITIAHSQQPFDLTTKPIYFMPFARGILSAASPQTIRNLSPNKLQITVESESGLLPTQGGLLSYGDKAFEIHPSLATSSKVSLSLLLMAFLAGIILNLMPCVFPILSFKALSLIHASQQINRRWNGLLYMLGVVCCFMLMALILYLLRLSGEAIGWGFQLQSPFFVGCMLVIFIIIFLMMIDIIPLTGRFAAFFDKLSRMNTFLTGFFAVLIASPCTGPLMGAVLGYAFMQPAQIYFPIFLCLGFGYALPFTLIETFPRVIAKILPKPGKWMQIIKYILAVPVFLTCIWLSWLLYNQRQTEKNVSRVWQVYNPQKIEALIADNHAVFIDFTAKWCVTCLLNERTSLHTSEFEKTAQENNIALFKADWTNREDNILQGLQQYGRSSVPLYVFYPENSGGSYQILPQILTPKLVINVLNGQNQDNNRDNH